MSKKVVKEICPENVGGLFLRDGEDIPYRLTNCETEPMASMERVPVDESTIPSAVPVRRPVSEFQDFKLVRSPDKEPKKPRSDKGGTHNKRIPQVDEVTIQ